MYAENIVRVRRHIQRVVEDDAEADEIVADVFRIAWEKLNPRSPFRLPWLLRTADNRIRNRQKREVSRHRAMAALLRGTPARGEDPSDSIAVRRALETLTARERRVVTMTYWDQLSAGEIAEVLHMSQGSVWTMLTRARAKLRAELDVSGEVDGHG